MYNEDFSINPMFGITLIAALAAVLGLTFLFSSLLKKYLKVGKTKLIMPFEIRERQKYMDKIIRNVYLILLALSVINYFLNSGLFSSMLPFAVPLVYILFSISVNIFREWKYAENPRTYMVSIGEAVLASMLLFAAYLLFPY